MNCNNPSQRILQADFTINTITAATSADQFTHTPLLRCNKDNIISVCQLPLTSGGHRPLGHLVKTSRGLAFEYEHEVLKGQYPQILTVRYRFPHGRPGSVHSGFKLSDHSIQAPPMLVATTSILIYDVLIYSHL